MIPPFVVVYSPRRTRISLTIRPEDGMLEVRAPEGFPRSRIEAVLARNPELIASLRKRGEAVRRQLPRFRFEEGEFFLLRGRWYPLKFSRRLLCFDEAFLVPAGTAVMLYSDTLHYSPCSVGDSAFQCIIVLPEGTNYPSEKENVQRTEEDKLLCMKNKWVLTHPDSGEPYFPGLKGDIITV